MGVDRGPPGGTLSMGNETDELRLAVVRQRIPLSCLADFLAVLALGSWRSDLQNLLGDDNVIQVATCATELPDLVFA